jgi:endonuclease-3
MEQERAIKQLKEIEKRAGVMRLAAEEWKEEWQTLIAIILSARTRDEVTIAVAENLFRRYEKLKDLANADLKDVEELVRRVNFYRNKAKAIVACAKVLDEKYTGKPPYDVIKLIGLPGVGRKTANVFLAEMGGDAIGVDTHTSYISQRLGWTQNTGPENIEKDLEKLFPKTYWRKINPALVHFGKSYLSRKEKDKILDEIKTVR